MLSALFLINQKGELILYRLYRCVISHWQRRGGLRRRLLLLLLLLLLRQRAGRDHCMPEHVISAFRGALPHN
jgi:hypothetical protein